MIQYSLLLKKTCKPWVFYGFSMASLRASSTKPRSAASVASTAGVAAAIRAATRRIALPRNACDPMTTLEFFGDLQFFSRKFSHKIPRPNWPTTYYPHQIDPLIFVSLSLSIHPAIHPSIYLFHHLSGLSSSQ